MGMRKRTDHPLGYQKKKKRNSAFQCYVACARMWVKWFIWVVPLVDLLLVPWLWACLLGVLGCLCTGCGLGLVCLSFAGVWVFYLVGCFLAYMWGLVLICLSLARGVGFAYLVVLPVGIRLFVYRADAPFPIFLGEVLSVFSFL